MAENDIPNKEVIKGNRFFNRKGKKFDSKAKSDDKIIDDDVQNVIIDTIDSERDPDYQEDYNAYLDAFYMHWYEEDGDPMSFEEFKSVNYGHDLPSLVEHAKLGFVPMFPMRPGSSKATSSSKLPSALESIVGNFSSELKATAAETVADIATVAVNKGTQFASEKAAELLSKAGMFYKAGTSSTDGSEPPGKVPGQRFSSYNGDNTGHNHSILNLNPKPLELQFKTPIVPRCYGPYDIDSSVDNSVLHLTGCQLSFGNMDTGSKLYSFYNNVLVTLFQIAAQRNISFNANASNNFSITNLNTYFDAVAHGLMIYYFYASIITYDDVDDNRNQGMLALRRMISSDDLDKVYQLGRLLRKYPVPPNLRTLCFFLSQTYQASSLAGAPLLKIMPLPFADSTDLSYYRFTGFYTTAITDAITAFRSAAGTETVNMLGRITENTDWYQKPLLVPFGNAIHDPQFSTLWCNLPNYSVNASGSSKKMPAATNSDTNITYSTHTDDLDGGIFALTNIWDIGNSKWTSNFLDPNVRSRYFTSFARSTNRISYFNAGGVNGFYPAVIDSTLSQSRGECINIQGDNVYTYTPFGTEKVANVNMNSVNESAEQLLEWCISLESLEKATNRKGSPFKSKGKAAKSKEEFK